MKWGFRMVSIGKEIDTMAHYTGERCARFRNDVLKVTQTDFCRNTGTNIKNISAFENGRANNIRYLFYYYNMCKTQIEQQQFTNYVFRGY